MAIKGIDISNWQAGIDVRSLGVDFCICKATEGKTFKDKSFDGFVNTCAESGILYGFYHFARENEPETEAEHFYNTVKDRLGKGIPVLDYEVWGKNSNDVQWCERFIKRFFDLSGVWCLIYISASHCKDFRGSWIPETCGLWVAGYPKKYTAYPSPELPYNVAPWRICAIWQFTDALRLNGYGGNLDGDLAYMDEAGWSLYAGESKVETSTDYNDLADQVITGRWGNGSERKARLDIAYGAGTYEKVQAIVNEKLGAVDYEKLATEVIAGKWGNGWNRQQALNNAYGLGTYDRVQAIVNKRLK